MTQQLAATKQTEQTAPQKSEQTFASSKGERLFNWLTYGGLAGVGTFIVTLGIAYKQKHAAEKSGFYNWMTSKLESLGASKNVAANITETTNLMHGGNLMIIPVAAVEHFKKPIVGVLNRVMGDKTTHEVEEAPKQSLWTLLKGRLVAWGIVFGSMFTASELFGKQLATFEHKVGSAFAGYKEVPTHDLKGMTQEAFQKLGKEEKVLMETKPYSIGKLAALDVFATAAAASLLYVGSHFFAKKAEQKRELKAEQKVTAANSAQVHHTRPTAHAHADGELPAVAERPEPTVHAVEHQAQLLSAPQAQIAAS